MESFLNGLVLKVNIILSCKLGGFHRNFSFILHSRNLDKREFPGSLVVRAQCFYCCSPCSIPHILGTEIPHPAAACRGQKQTNKNTEHPDFPFLRILFSEGPGDCRPGSSHSWALPSHPCRLCAPVPGLFLGRRLMRRASAKGGAQGPTRDGNQIID